jgi:hypothetical protein
MVPNGSLHPTDSFCPSVHSAVSSAASSPPDSNNSSSSTSCSSTVHSRALLEPRRFQAFLRLLFRENWVVYVKPPFGGPEHVLNYLARYTHRLAISNHRLVAFQNNRVSFRWKDYTRGGKQKIMTVSAEEFLRRFLIHVLPKGLVRIRHFGLSANRRRGDMLSRCRDLLSAQGANEPDAPTHWRCPVCAGPMLIIERLTSSQLYFQSALTMPDSQRCSLDSS